MTTHATVWAIQQISGDFNGAPPFPPNIPACDWTGECGAVRFGSDFPPGEPDAIFLQPVPDCPTCAAFIDLALSIRAEEAQTRINAEIDAERRKTA